MNNVLGGPVVGREALQRAAQQVVRETHERQEEHIRPGGWYSHSVLVTALKHVANGEHKVIFNRLEADQYDALMSDPLAIGALVNENNAHWSALVRHAGLLWHVDSKFSPKLMDRDAFKQCLQTFPSTFAVTRKEHPWE